MSKKLSEEKQGSVTSQTENNIMRDCSPERFFIGEVLKSGVAGGLTGFLAYGVAQAMNIKNSALLEFCVMEGFGLGCLFGAAGCVDSVTPDRNMHERAPLMVGTVAGAVLGAAGLATAGVLGYEESKHGVPDLAIQGGMMGAIWGAAGALAKCIVSDMQRGTAPMPIVSDVQHGTAPMPIVSNVQHGTIPDVTFGDNSIPSYPYPY